MLATVYDINRRQVTHYLNGKANSNEAVPEGYLVERVQIGNASVCNWSLLECDEPRFAVCRLNGSLRKFARFRTALSPEEIEEIYHRGKP